MSELRAGGLAVIINSRIPENIGVTVRLLKHLGVVTGHTMSVAYDSWTIEAASNRKLAGYIPDGSLIMWPTVTCPSKWLMPIDGEDFSHEDKRQKELVNGQTY